MNLAYGSFDVVLGDLVEFPPDSHALGQVRKGNETSVQWSGNEAYFDNLDGEFIVEVPNSQKLSPEALVGGEGVDANTGAHFVELGMEVARERKRYKKISNDTKRMPRFRCAVLLKSTR